MKKIALLWVFISIGFIPYLTASASMTNQRNAELSLQTMVNGSDFYATSNVPENIGPDVKIRVNITMTDGGTIGAGVTWGPDGKDCITIELYVNDLLVGTFDDCP